MTVSTNKSPSMKWLFRYTFDNINYAKEVNIYQSEDTDGGEVFHGVGVIEGVDVGNNVQFRDYYNLDELKVHCKEWLY